MSIKDFFYKKEVVLEDQSKLTSSVESADLIEEIREQNRTFVPDVDFSDPKNFARFGSAKEYYEGSIKRIYEQYPYDGSEAEKLSFYNDSTFLDQWLFDNKYPKSTGYAIFSADGWSAATKINDYGKPDELEYIYSAGGLREASLYQHTGSDTISSGQLKDVFDKGVKHDSDKNRTLNYRMKMDDGLTIQFWMKKDEFLPSSTKREVILDLWNGVTTSGSHDYGRLILEMSASDKQESALRLTLYSGSYGIVDQPIALSTYSSASIANGEWQHHTITVKAASQNLEINYYNNGILNSGSTYGTTNTLGEIPNNINGYLGALQTASYGDDYHNEDMVGAGKLSASLDDFRYWKKELDAQYIKNTWFYPIGGGSNSDDNRTSLGVYYKFNEGVVGNTAYDATVLDYSGRIANGTWTGYTSNSRNTGSAYVSASTLQSEPGDPIIRLDHPDVQSLLTEMATSGSNHDRDNTIRMYDMVPAWLREEDTNENINYLFQILSSYFDTLYCQIKEVPKLKDKNYFDSGNMPYEFIDRMLSEKGLLVPNTFISSDILNTFWQRDKEDNYFEQSIEKTKRQIYYNIYNNLEFILKSKGTEKSFRNLLRCFGIDDEVVKLNVYTDNATHYLKDRYKNSSVKSKFVNFNKTTRFDASITQTSSSINTLTYISGSDTERLERNNAFTIEGDVLFPEPRKIEDNDYFVASFISSSIFGFHEANSSDSTDYTFGGSNDANLQFYAVKEEVGSTSAKFVIKNADDSILVESDLFEDVYTNERWNFSLTVKPVGYPFAGSFLSSSNPDYNIRLYGVTYNNEEIKSQFTLTASVSNTVGISLLTKPKRLYVGANKTNFTGSVINSTDVKIGSIRMWMDKLSNEAIQQHNLDPKNYGHNKIYGSPTVFFHDISGSSQIPAMDSLILHWNFDENVSSDANGELIVEDFSSGSTSNLYGWASNIIERENKGLGLDFPASEEVFTNEFIFARRKELPEISFTDDRIIIMDDEKEFFIEDEDTTDNIFSLEKSMNQSISEEMIRTFSTMKEYANLFAKPVDYYRQDYKRLRKARSLFFERTTGNPDFDKFTEYFKWIDTSVSFFIEQLKPASVTFNEGVANVVESHIFERPKNERKFPTVKTLQSTMGSLRGIGELDYNWKFGHAPDYKEATNGEHCLWRKQRENREDIANRETIRKILGSKTSGIIKRLGDPTTDPQTAYIAQGYAEATRRFSKPYKLSVEVSTTIHGGTNYNDNRNRDFIFDNIKPHGSRTELGIPVNVVVVGVGEGQGIINNSVCDDVEIPNEKEKYDFRMTVAQHATLDGHLPRSQDLDLVYEVKSAYGSPFNIFSGSVPDGANREVSENYKDDVILTNLHSDTTYMANDVPMQGPFTETWVGGRQNRHVALNRHDTTKKTEGGGATVNNIDDQYSRPEAYRLLMGEHPDESIQDGALGFVGPDYGGPYPDPSRKWAIYYRDFRAKRPYNIQNIQGDQYRQGNYTEKYEYFNSVGRSENNLRFKKQADTWDFLAEEVKNEFPETTNQIGLFSVEPSNDGNIASGFDSNRHNDALGTAVPGVTGVAASGSFKVTGSTLYNSQYTGSFTIAGVPQAAQYPYVSFKVSGSGVSVSDSSTITITASSETFLGEIADPETGINNIDADAIIYTGSYGLAIQFTSSDDSFHYADNQSITGYTSSNDISVSYWTKNENSSAPLKDLILFRESDNQLRCRIRTSNNTTSVQVYTDDASSEDTATFTTDYSDGNWKHVVITINYSDYSEPDLWLNGQSITPTGWATLTGTNSNPIEKLFIYLYDKVALQDLVIWNKKLVQEDVDILYASGNWNNPSTHPSSSYIIDWYKYGYEGYWSSTYSIVQGNVLDDVSGTKYFSSSFGFGQNDLLINNNFDDEAKFVQGNNPFGAAKDNDTIWNELTSAIETEITEYNVGYVSASSEAQFFLTSGPTGTATVEIAETGNLFDSLLSGSGGTATASNLEDGDTVTIESETFTVRHTTSGSITERDLIVGSSYRKALLWPANPDNEIHLKNTSYTNPTSNNVSFSFWLRMIDETTGDKYIFDSSDGSNTSITIYISNGTDLKILLRGAADSITYTLASAIEGGVWTSFTINIDVNDGDGPGGATVFKNGALQTLTHTTPAYSINNVRDLTEIYIGDSQIASGLYELQGTLQDFAIWNMSASLEDAQILYNSGSWLDLHSHPSASYIWDWWTLGEDVAVTSGSALAAANFPIEPTIGQHDLAAGANAVAEIYVTDGTIETARSNADWWQHAEDQFDIELSYNVERTNGDIEVNTTGYNLSDTLSETGDTFTSITGLTHNGDILSSTVGGAEEGDYLQIDTTRFIIDTTNANAGGTFAKVGSHYYINSSASSNDIFWDRLSGAIEQEFSNYPVSYTNVSNTATMQITASVTGTVENRTLTENGNSYFDLLGIAGGVDYVAPTTTPKYRNIVQVESDFITGSTRNRTVIASRFSAPGGVEVQTYGYLDAYAHEYSVHNNLNYRNLSIRGSGSGESGTIRVNSHANTRDGLRTLYQRPMGRGGVDSVHEQVDETDYNLTASFHKVPRNTLVTPRSGSSAVEIVERSNNYNYQSTIPASDYNYSWVTSSLGDNYNVRSGTQKVFGYWPKDGLNKVNGIVDTAITFPTASDIVGV